MALKVFEFCIVVLVLVHVHGVICAPQSDLIVKIPDQPENVSFNQYGGYVTTDEHNGRALFYYFVEAEKNPESMPLVLWFNGGPGCSSVGYGAFEEHGPFKLRGELLYKNDFSWNKEANILYVESPIGVGFSYSNTSSDYQLFNDTQTAQDNLEFLLNWFKKFPEYRNSDFYVTGESYGGHYIPQFASLLLDYNKRPNITSIKLKAILMGNPYVDIELSINSNQFQWSHGLISDDTYLLTETVCNNSKYWVEWFVTHNISKDCHYVVERVNKEIGSNFDPYDVTSDVCLGSGSYQTTMDTQQSKIQQIPHKFVTNSSTNFRGGINLCSDVDILYYLNRPDVQKALHANTTVLPYQWSFCNGPVKYDESNRAINIIPVLSDLLNAGLPITLFSGDQDSIVPFTATRTIANNLAKELNLNTLIPYSAWYHERQVAGWSQTFGHELNGKNQTILTFATVRGGAHEVPYTNPSQALALFRAFLKGQPL